MTVHTDHMEIERKWLVSGWPDSIICSEEKEMRQGYVSTSPAVRIREERSAGEETEYILCFKSEGGLSRREIEIAVSEAEFRGIEEMIGLPLIHKLQRRYPLPSGEILEVNQVDEGCTDAFWYAEVEFETEERARAFSPEETGLRGYLEREVTSEKG